MVVEELHWLGLTERTELLQILQSSALNLAIDLRERGRWLHLEHRVRWNRSHQIECVANADHVQAPDTAHGSPIEDVNDLLGQHVCGRVLGKNLGKRCEVPIGLLELADFLARLSN